MVIKFSRHAKRKSKLYNISEDLIISIIENLKLIECEHEIIRNVPGFKYPLKIIVKVKSNIITVVTNYLLKKGRKE